MKRQNVKIVAFYLPQFHTFPENDRWWGEGFTEWTNVKNADSLYTGHNQPRVPLNEDYYSLLEEGTMQRQMKMAREYGIYGFCYYHYWFDGKLLLEKPLERMLKSEDKIPFCLCWANEPWTRAWEGKSEVLMGQRYGDEGDWEEHFQYLLPYFSDPYYMKEDLKPILVLYRTNNIPDCSRMIDYWNLRCIEEGFGGIYIVEEKNGFQKEAACGNSDAVLEFEPMYTLKHGRSVVGRAIDKAAAGLFNTCTGNHLLIYSYDRIWRRIVRRKRKEEAGKKLFCGGFVDWDNTPRKGEYGLVIRGATPEKFAYYMERQLAAARKMGSDYVFINAWNEWGEGTYLEPDSVHGFQYLERIRLLLSER